MKAGLIGLSVFLLASPAAAQTSAAITGTHLQIFRTGDALTGPPFREQPIDPAVITCNLAPTTLPPQPVVNPSGFEWNESTNTGRVCKANVATFLRALPDGAYVATITYGYLSEAGPAQSPKSVASLPFNEAPFPLAPAAPTGLGAR